MWDSAQFSMSSAGALTQTTSTTVSRVWRLPFPQSQTVLRPSVTPCLDVSSSLERGRDRITTGWSRQSGRQTPCG